MHLLKKVRIFLINLFAVVIAYSYTKPRKFIREVFSKKSLTGIINQLYNPSQSDELKALSAAFGIFMGILPIWGLQTLAAIFFAVLLRLNKAVVVIFSQVSFPPLMPLIIFFSYKAGAYWMATTANESDTASKPTQVTNGNHFEQYIYGSIALAIIASITVGILMFAVLKLAKMLKQFKLTASWKKAL
ncbi:MAG TPA: DUF2062 domain-containing protein [Mucilaginibacter sp.]|jgi:uncharacterized protein (DUF2062 family)